MMKSGQSRRAGTRVHINMHRFPNTDQAWISKSECNALFIATPAHKINTIIVQPRWEIKHLKLHESFTSAPLAHATGTRGLLSPILAITSRVWVGDAGKRHDERTK
ncbi:hypothetical protein BaRGS_00031680, partial [Batillaria attramentaria]